MTDPVASGWRRAIYGIAVAALAISGMAQMPIFKRYYLADMPGLGWLAQYYVTHTIHYLAAAVFLAILFYAATRYLRLWSRNHRLTGFGWARIVVITVLVTTGLLRVLKNRPEIVLELSTLRAVSYVHLASAVLLGLLALAAIVLRRKAYLTPRGGRSPEQP